MDRARTDRLPGMHRASTVLVQRFFVQGSARTSRCRGASWDTVLSSPFTERIPCMYRTRVSSHQAHTILSEKIGQVCPGRRPILDYLKIGTHRLRSCSTILCGTGAKIPGHKRVTTHKRERTIFVRHSIEKTRKV